MNSADIMLRDEDYETRLEPEIRRLHTSHTTSKYSIKQIQEHHREMVRLAAAGYKNSEIAEHLGVHINTVNNCLNNPLVKEAIIVLRAKRDDIVLEARGIIEKKAASLAQHLVDIADNPANKVTDRLRAIDSALDRAGLARLQKTENTKVEQSYSTIEHIRRIASTNGATSNPNIEAIDVTVVETKTDGVNSLPLSTLDDTVTGC